MNLKVYHLQLWTVAALTAAGGVSAPAQETNPVNPRDFAAFKIISERNIFDPNRQPPRTTPPPRPAIVDSFGLYGTMSYGDKGPLAVFSGSHSEYHKVLEAGGSIAGFTVKQIEQGAVKLLAGTNETDLKVGMQMRRSADGLWSVAEQSDFAGASYASNTRSQGSGRSERRLGRDNNRSDRRTSRNFGSESNGGSQADTSGGMAQDMAAGAQMEGDVNPPPEPGNSEPSDPVARMMLRRQQETGGNANANDNQNPGGSQNPPGEPPPGNENSTPNQ